MDNEENPKCEKLTTLKALHQTILTLHNALNTSQSQLNLLKLKLKLQESNNSSHGRKEQVLSEKYYFRNKRLSLDDSTQISYSNFILNTAPMSDFKTLNDEENSQKSLESKIENNAIIDKTCIKEANLRSRSCDYPEGKEKLSVNDRSLSEGGNDFRRLPDQTTISKEKIMGDSDNDSEELNDIELIFTTEETKELGVLQEDLVSITEGETWHPNPSQGQKFSSNIEGNRYIKSTKSNEDLYNKVSTHSVLVETDISKCGVIDSHPNSSKSFLYDCHEPKQRNPQFSNTIKRSLKFSSDSNHGEKLQITSLKSSIRPILVQKHTYKKESEAQTDITALPSHWRSESYLAHKVSYNFTTLPSKFTLPFSHMNRNKSSLKLADKSREARRTLLSDINFTSMVPELSKSADHLCQDPMNNNGVYQSNKNSFKNMESKRKRENLISPNYKKHGDNLMPCDCLKYHQKSNREHYYQTCTGSSFSSVRSNNYDLIESKKRHSWKFIPEMSKSISLNHPSSWRSVPSSPIFNQKSKIMNYDLANSKFFYHLDSNPSSSVDYKNKFRSKNKVTFKDSYLERATNYGMSCPDLRREYDLDSGDSTDSLIDEAEEYLRSSIDSILTGEDCSKITKKKHLRRYSEPDLIRNSGPPFNAEPFLPKHSGDLKLNYFVKIITLDGKVLIGRVRYIGNSENKIDTQIGVELSQPLGDTDGTYLGKRMFNCNADHALFVPFKKVIMAWSY